MKELCLIVFKKIKSFIVSRFTSTCLLIGIIFAVNITSSSKPLYQAAYNLYGTFILTYRDSYSSALSKICKSLDTCDQKINTEMKLSKRLQDRLIHENTLLRQQLKLASETNYQYVTAFVTHEVYPKGERSLIISAGIGNGLEVGNLVLSEYGIVGRVSQVTEKFSIVSLLGSNSVKIAAIILPSHDQCMVSSISDGYLTINYLNNSNHITNGSAVVSSGKDNITPYGIQIGTTIKKNGKVYLNFDTRSFDALLVKVIIRKE